MYKVFIVDDEPIIVEGLRKSIKWEEYDCKVVGTASSGKEALDLISKKQPDLIISDISMPELDGLQMIAAIKAQYPRIQITILTGYRDFDYAQEAIRLGVTRFLLKPSKMNELKEAVKTMVDALKELEVVEEATPTTQPLEEQEGTQVKFTVESESNSFIVKNALTYIEANYTRKLKLIDVAEETYVSQWHLSKLLNRHMGQNFSEILNGVRIQHAKELLKDPSLRIGDIAEEVGFLDMAHFSRVFKKQNGISANAYRNEVLGKKTSK
ncbi:MAG: response regulator [Eubacteriales bacterium]